MLARLLSDRLLTSLQRRLRRLRLPLLAAGALLVASAGAAHGADVAQGAATSAAPTARPHDLQRATYDPIHFKPAIDKATNAQCLSCHAEVLKPSVRATSPAGVQASTALAWYQRLSTYEGAQDTFHRRHLETPMAKRLMDLRCVTCHQGNDPRDENPWSSATSQRPGGFDLRKMVVTQSTCLKCHGPMNFTVMGLPEPWAKSRAMFGDSCLVCHASIRTTRHEVNYLKAKAIEAAGATGSDTCYGCHGGRAWYRTSFPYTRHPWPGMPDEIPDWAKGRPTATEVRFLQEAMNGAPPAATTTASHTASTSVAKP